MRVKRWSCALLAAFVLLATVAMPATAAVQLPAKLAGTKAFVFACQKLVRVALDPITYRILVTGSSPRACH